MLAESRPGTAALIAVALFFAGGALSATLGDSGFFRALLAWTMSGLGYGLFGYGLARRGMLPLLGE